LAAAFVNSKTMTLNLVLCVGHVLCVSLYKNSVTTSV